MAMVVDQTVAELEFSGYSTTTTTTIEDEHGCNWNYWSPMVDWDAISGSHDDFHDLVESMMDDNVAVLHHDHHHHDAAAINADMEGEMEGEGAETSGGDDSKGLRLVHLLMAAAEALTGANKSRSGDIGSAQGVGVPNQRLKHGAAHGAFYRGLARIARRLRRWGAQ